MRGNLGGSAVSLPSHPPPQEIIVVPQIDIDGYAAYLHNETNDPTEAAGPCCVLCRREEPPSERGTFRFVATTLADRPEVHKYYDPDALCPEHYDAVCKSYRDMKADRKAWLAEQAASARGHGDARLASYYEAQLQEEEVAAQ